jgi:hypothetical protein
MTKSSIENELRDYLRPGEKFIWTGRPKRGIIFRKADRFLITASLLWVGFVTFWAINMNQIDAPFFTTRIKIIVVFTGVYITIGRFFTDAKKRANTVYGITTDRIIIKSGIFFRDIESLNINDLSEITVDQEAGNIGTITLGPKDKDMMVRLNWPGTRQVPKLDLIEDVKYVHEEIINLQRRNYYARQIRT